MTAQRREQSLQDVPISVTAVTGEAIEEGGFLRRGGHVGLRSQPVHARRLHGPIDHRARHRHLDRQRGVRAGCGIVLRRRLLRPRQPWPECRVRPRARGSRASNRNPRSRVQSATAGADQRHHPQAQGETWDGDAAVAYGNDEETSADVAIGGPIHRQVRNRGPRRATTISTTRAIASIVGNVPQGVKESTAERLIAVSRPTDSVDITLEYRAPRRVASGAVQREYTVCETRPQFGRANGTSRTGSHRRPARSTLSSMART